MPNPLIAQLATLLHKYGSKLPPLEERRPLWAAIVSVSDEGIRKEFSEYVNNHVTTIHTILLGEISRILHD